MRLGAYLLLFCILGTATPCLSEGRRIKRSDEDTGTNPIGGDGHGISNFPVLEASQTLNAADEASLKKSNGLVMSNSLNHDGQLLKQKPNAEAEGLHEKAITTEEKKSQRDAPKQVEGGKQASCLSSDIKKGVNTVLEYLLGDRDQKLAERLYEETNRKNFVGGSATTVGEARDMLLGGTNIRFINPYDKYHSPILFSSRSCNSNNKNEPTHNNENGNSNGNSSNNDNINTRFVELNINGNDKKLRLAHGPHTGTTERNVKKINGNNNGGNLHGGSKNTNRKLTVNNNNVSKNKNEPEKKISMLKAMETKLQNHLQQAQNKGEKGPPPSLVQQQQRQIQALLGHTPSVLKFANMLLYKVGANALRQSANGGTQSPGNGNNENTDDFDTADYFYNNENNLRTAGNGPILAAGGATMAFSPPYLFSQQFNGNDGSLPINLIENALDTLFSNELDNDEEVEVRCPVHHERKNGFTDEGTCTAPNKLYGGGTSLMERSAAMSNGGGRTDGNNVVQVCSCRFFKKKKNAQM